MILGNQPEVGIYFSDEPDMKNNTPYKISKITVYHNSEYVLGIKANYYSFRSFTTIKCKHHKVVKQLFGVKKTKLNLEWNEYINYVSGNHSDQGIIVIFLKTNLNKQLLVGALLGAQFEWNIPDKQQLGFLSGGLNTKHLQYLELISIPYKENTQGNNIQYNWDIDHQYLLHRSKHSQQQSQPLNTEESKQQIFMDEGQAPSLMDIFDTPWDQRFVIQVCNPLTMKSQQDYQLVQKVDDLLKISKYVQYEVIVWRMSDLVKQDDQLSHLKTPFIQISRRLKEFILLRKVLVAKWPGIYVPYLPVENIVNDFSFRNIERIRLQLESFITRVSNIPFLYQSIEFQIFIKSLQTQKSLSDQLEELLNPATKEQVRLRYEQTFSAFKTSPPLSDQLKTKLLNFQEFLSKHRQTLDNQIKLLLQLKSKHDKMVSLSFNLSKHYLPYHLKTIVPELQINEIVTDKQLKFNKDIYDELIQQIQFEEKQIEALRSCSNYLTSLDDEKAQLQHKISGKSFNLKPPTQEQLLQYRKDWDSIEIIQQLIQSIFCEYYISSFYQEKAQFYYFVTNRIAKMQQQNLQIKQEYWEQIKQNQ